MGAFLEMNMGSLASIGKELRSIAPEIHKAMRVEMKDVADVIASRAREHASWSRRIPGTIKGRVLGNGTTVAVSAGGGKGSAAPHAKPIEHAGQSGKFRHPVHADPALSRSEWTWVDQEARPFLHPALFDELPEAARRIEEALTAAINKLGEV